MVCLGVVLNGVQVTSGGCSNTPLGLIPSRMASALIVTPKDGAVLDSRVPNIVRVVVRNQVTGFFSDPNTQYYTEPQRLLNGRVLGHQHITVESLESLNPSKFIFFKGLDDTAINDSLQVEITASTFPAPGAYRICSISGSNTHQPILSKSVKRGPQNDCVRVQVKDSTSGLIANNSATNDLNQTVLKDESGFKLNSNASQSEKTARTFFRKNKLSKDAAKSKKQSLPNGSTLATAQPDQKNAGPFQKKKRLPKRNLSGSR